MSLAHWCAAFDAYALAAACADQWNYTAAHTHKSLVLKVATDGRLLGQPAGVAVIYDELVRRHMATRVAVKATGYSQDTPMLEVGKSVVEKTVTAYEPNDLMGNHRNVQRPVANYIYIVLYINTKTDDIEGLLVLLRV